jgi:hypothetical protein
MKQIEATYPKTIQDCTPDQLTKWLMLAPVIQNQDKNLSQMLDFHCQVISIFTGLTINQVRKAHVDDILALSGHLLKMLAEFKTTEPSGRVVIDGKTYVFEKDFNYITTGQIIDMKLIEDVTQSPAEALAICYIEEGMEYVQEDHRGKVLNPNKKREEIFKASFPGDEFLNFFAFFLRESEKRKLAIMGIQSARMTVMNQELLKQLSEIPNGSSGQRTLSSFRKNWHRLWTLSLVSRT